MSDDGANQERPAPGAPSGMRASDAERDAVLTRLGEHSALGRLTLAELEERAGRVRASKTHAQRDHLMGGDNTIWLIPAEAQHLPARQARKTAKQLGGGRPGALG